MPRRHRHARHQLKAFLLRSGICYAGKTAWTPAHVRWIARIKLDQPVQQIVFQEYVAPVTTASERLERVEGNLRDAVLEWRRKPLVEALQALRDVQPVVAATLAAEIGQTERFANPRQLMAYLGLVPCEIFQRPIDPPRLDHHVRQHPRPPRADRGCMGLAAAGADHADHRQAPGQTRQEHPQQRLEGASAAMQALSIGPCVLGARSRTKSIPGDRPRAVRLRLGHRP